MSDGRPQRGSIFTGLLLILLGALFLLQRFDPQLGIAHLLHRYWPVLLIVWGAAKLIDYYAAGRSGEGRPPLLSGGEAALLGLLVVVLAGMAVMEWLPRIHPDWFAKAQIFSSKTSQSQSLPAVALPAGSRLRIQIHNGSVTVRGSDSSELHVSADEQGGGSSEKAAQERLSALQIALDHSGQEYLVHTTGPGAGDDSVRVDLDVELPKQTPLDVQTEMGDVMISGIAANVNAETGGGDLDVHDSQGDVIVTVSDGDTHVSDIKGSATLNGRGNDVDVNDISGNATLAGIYEGTVVVRNVAGTTQYAGMRTNLVLTNLTGRLEADAGDLKINDVSGSVRVATKDKDVEIENVTGTLDVTNTRGDIDVRFDQPPANPVNVANGTGDVSLTLPAGASFQISAVTGSGEVQSDFEGSGLQLENGDKGGKLTGNVGKNGPRINLTTDYGTIQIRKSS
jgi:hypothetical protein